MQISRKIAWALSERFRFFSILMRCFPSIKPKILLMKLICALLPSLLGCITDQGKEPSLFGAYYDLVQTQAMPSVTADSVYVRVAYSGCSGNHLFTLRYRAIASATTELWLFKETSDQPCDAYFEENKTYSLPDEVRRRQKIVLVGPFDKRFTLRQ